MGEKFYTYLIEGSKIILNFLLFNALWLLLTSPALIVLMQMMLSESFDSLYVLLPILILLLPLTFFPATQALFNTIRELIVQDEWMPVSLFFKEYKDHFKNSLLSGVFITGWFVILGALLYLCWQISLIFSVVVLMFILYSLLVVLCYFFITAHYRMSLKWKWKQSFVFCAAHPVFVFLLFMANVLLLYILWDSHLLLFILSAAAVSTYVTVYILIKKVNQLTKKRTAYKPANEHVNQNVNEKEGIQ